ncbi:MAG: OmpH family outer membrane protein [Deltaproteobacteria bacterium]|nr:OmpH family outer membrane protein [Deltaproteobacteria bacterium]
MPMKMSLFPILALTALLLAGCAGKVAVINPDLIFQDSEGAKAGLGYLTDLSQELQEKIASPPRDGRKGRASDAALQQSIGEAQARFNEEQQRVMGQVNSLFLKALEACRLRGRFSVILVSEAALAHDPAADITRMVLEEMNKTPVVFSSQSAGEGEEPSPPAE